MKRIMMIVFSTMFFLCFFVVSSALAEPMVSLNLLDSYITVGESFDVEVWADGDDIGEGLLAFGFDVSMDYGTCFSYNGYAVESGFDDDSADGFNPHDVGGSVFEAIFDDDVLLATLSFSALAAGTDHLNIWGPNDLDFSGLYYEVGLFDINASLAITITDSVPVPEPSTLLLVGAGLAGLVGMRRKLER